MQLEDGLSWSELDEQSADLCARLEEVKTILGYEKAKEELQGVREELKAPDLWDKPDAARTLNKREAVLTGETDALEKLAQESEDLREMIRLSRSSAEDALIQDLTSDLGALRQKIEDTEFRSVFSGPHDADNAFLEIQAGSGGTEAQDWAEMLLRMYLRWCERRKFRTEVLEYSAGEVAGIKGASVSCKGDYAYGWLRTETGIHRLVRKSPFDSGNRRHTSFASVFVLPDVDENIEVDINSSDLRIDTYRASGAGGQHVNKTDSAVRITHIPTGIVAQCQSQRSQHQNKDNAMRQLRAKLYKMELDKKTSEKKRLEASKDDISWGYQIRSYVLDNSRIKDLRTGVEVSDCGRVLDGDLDPFIEAGLKYASKKEATD